MKCVDLPSPRGESALRRRLATLAVVGLCLYGRYCAADVEIDLSAYHSESGVRVDTSGQSLHARWPISKSQFGFLELELSGEHPLVRRLGLEDDDDQTHVLLENVDPVTFITVGSRQGIRSKGWTVFFDKVHKRPYQTYQADLEIQAVRVISQGSHTTVEINQLTAGPFRGKLCLTFYRGCELVHIEAALTTEQDRVAYLYDAGLVAQSPSWNRLGWRDTTGSLQRKPVQPADRLRILNVRHRSIVAESEAGSVALFPAPHQYFYPLDFSTNLGFTWYGRGMHELDRYGFGIRQHPEGDQRFVPWVNAPPGSEQRLSFFCLLSRGSAADAADAVLRFTRHDRFQPLPGHITFTSHYHFAHTMDVMGRRAAGKSTSFEPGFVSILKEMGVQIVHMAEFHGDGNPRDTGPKRLPQLQLMHQECERLSDENFLLLPGEEPNVHFGGHWMILFPKPVYWIMSRQADQPFVQQDSYYGTVYRIGNSDELLEMLERERGLAWTAHARIKSSHGYPDKHRHENFYLSDRWFGAAWKAMPSDLSHPRLGQRVLTLLSDMDNWGQKKYAIGKSTSSKSIQPTSYSAT